MSYIDNEVAFIQSLLAKINKERERITKGQENWEPPAFLLADLEGALTARLAALKEHACRVLEDVELRVLGPEDDITL